MQAQPYDFTLPANGSVRIDVVGSTAKLLSSSGLVQINTDTGARVRANPGQGIRNFDFGSITLVDKSGAPNKGFILIADADMIDDRITGEVSVIDGGRSRTLAKQAYIGTAYCAAVAAQNAAAQLWNPAGSGKNIIISSVSMASLTASNISVVPSNANLSTLGTSARMKLVSGAAPACVAETRYSSQVGQPAGVIAGWFGVYLSASKQEVFIPKEPIVITPGYGLTFVAQSVNTDVGVIFDFYEEPV